MRVEPEDFEVDEDLGFEPDGEGPHLLVRVRKRDANTAWVAGRLAAHCGVAVRDVGYAGLKDRRAVATQWFSLPLDTRPVPDWTGFDAAEILECHRHRRKLRRGALRGNRFRLRIRELSGDREALERRLAGFAAGGCPNYFGPQRFGRGGSNLAAARSLLGLGDGRRGPRRDRHRRGLALSAARSLVFNRVLAERIRRGCWDRLVPGDVAMLDGSRSVFPVPDPDPGLAARAATQDLHPTGPLWGDGPRPVGALAAEIEDRALEGAQEWCTALEDVGLRQERRALRVRIADPFWEWEAQPSTLVLAFGLPAGAYATVVLAELLEEEDEEPREHEGTGTRT